MEPLFLSDQQMEKLTRYIRDQRDRPLIRMWCMIVMTVLMLPLLVMDLQLFLLYGKYSVVSAVTAAGEMMMRHNQPMPPGAFSLMWVVVLAFTISLVLQNYNVIFGPKCDLNCLQRGEYTLSTEICCGKSVDTGKHPYYIYDTLQKPYKCPVFLEWKQLEVGDEAIFVTLSNDSGYVLKKDEGTGAKEWWEEDPY